MPRKIADSSKRTTIKLDDGKKKRGRPRKDDVKVTKTKLMCNCCGTEWLESEYYRSNSMINAATKKLLVCKTCLHVVYKTFLEESMYDERIAIFRMCRLLNYPFLEKVFSASEDERVKRGEVGTGTIFGFYLKNINSLPQYATYTFESGDTISLKEQGDVFAQKDLEAMERESNDLDRQNERDCVRMIGFNPFETENKRDQRSLFNKLIDLLDDSCIGDAVKLHSVISVAKGFNQIEHIDSSIAKITQNKDTVIQNAGNLKAFLAMKKDLTASILKICEDNGISAKFNNSKSKGSGTLTGMIKEMSNLNLDDIKVNLFDIQTSKGMQQVADISSKSIMEQLNFAENDYADMVSQQREMIVSLRDEKNEIEEELRKMRIELDYYKSKNTKK